MSTSTVSNAAHRPSFRASQHLNEIGLLVVIVLLYILFGTTTTGFFTFANQMNILRDASAIGIAAWGATMIIIAGEIDVSVGPMVAFISVIFAYLIQFGTPLFLAIGAALILGIVLGAVAGVLRAMFNVPSFIATLGLWSALRGLALFISNALPVTFGESDFLDALGDNVLGVPCSAIVMLVLFVAFLFVSRKTAYGRSAFAIGGNANAAALCGINVKQVRILLFAVAGLLAGISGVILTARLGSGNAGAASGLEFDVIAAVVVGGTALSGGRGSMSGTLLGVLVITLIGNGLVLMGVNPFFQQVVRGFIIVIAVLVNISLSKHGARRSARA